MSKKRTTTEKEKVDAINLWTQSDVGKDFTKWWKDHRHSGYATKPGTTYVRWGIWPYSAWMCDRYRAEYASCRGVVEHLSFEYEASDYERWAQDQKQADEAVAEFARTHNGREVPTQPEFLATLRECVTKLSGKFQAPPAPPPDKTEEEIHAELHAHQQKFKT